MDSIQCDLKQLQWDRSNLQGKNHTWRYASKYPIPGTTVEEDRARAIQSLSSGKLQKQILDWKKSQQTAVEAHVSAVSRFEALQHQHTFGALLEQVEDVIASKEELLEAYGEYRKENVARDETLFALVNRREFGKVLRLVHMGEVNINAAEPINNSTALMKAVAACKPQVVKLFLEAHADPNQENKMGMVALHYLWDTWLRIKAESLFKVVKLIHTIMVVDALLKGGANPNMQFPTDDRTALHYAAEFGHAQIALLLLKYKADTSIRDSTGRTPLQVALDYDQAEVAGLIRNWRHIATQLGAKEFRNKWETFLGNGQKLRSLPAAEDLIKDLNAREREMAHHEITQIDAVDELQLAIKEHKAAVQAEKDAAAAAAEQAAREEEEDDEPTVSLSIGTAGEVQLDVRNLQGKTKRKSDRARNATKRTERRLKELEHFRTIKAIAADFNKRTAKAAGRWKDPLADDEPEAKQSDRERRRSRSSSAGTVSSSIRQARLADDASQGGAGQGAGQGSAGGDDDDEDDTDASSMAGDTASVTSGSTATSTPSWFRRRRKGRFDSIVGRRRKMAARAFAEDAYAADLTKSYDNGTAYVRRTVSMSAALRGGRLRVDQLKIASKADLGRRQGEAQEDESTAISDMLSRSKRKQKPAKRSKATAESPGKPRSKTVVVSFSKPGTLPPVLESGPKKVKTAMEKEAERTRAHEAQIQANKYNVVLHEGNMRQKFYKGRFGDIEDPWKYHAFSFAKDAK